MSTSVDVTLGQREEIYGNFAERSAIVQAIKDAMAATPNWHKLPPDMRQSLEVVADKVSRILNGRSTEIDSWHDIGGYARLVESRLIQEEHDRKRKPSVIPETLGEDRE